MSPLLSVLIVTALAAGVLAWIGWRLNRMLRPAAVDAGWWDRFHPEKYRPLVRLLDEEEIRFLRSQRSCHRRIIWRFRAERARICLRFLQEMKVDFDALQAVGQALIIANRCSPGFHEELFRQRLRFSLAWWRVRAMLPLWRIGLIQPDPAPLLETLDSSASAVRLALAPVS